LIESNQRVADNVLGLTATFNRLIPVLDQLRRDVYDILNGREIDRERVDLRLRDIDSRLGIIKENVDGAAEDIEMVHRDITNPRIPLMPPEMMEEQRKPAAVRIIEALERTSMGTKIFIAIVVVLLTLSGWLTHLLSSATH
jgi:hypothetical protein